jgi:hypothetical protein
LTQKTKWHEQRQKVLSEINNIESIQSSVPAVTNPTEIVPMDIQVTDPNLINYPDLLQKYTPLKLLDKYQKCIKKGKLKIQRENAKDGLSICHVKFHTVTKSFATKGEHSSSNMIATYQACQAMLSQLFPKITVYINLMKHIDVMNIIEVKF